MLDKISSFILNFKAKYVMVWILFILSLSLILLFTGQYTTDLYYASMFDIGIPIAGWLGIQYYKYKFNYVKVEK